MAKKNFLFDKKIGNEKPEKSSLELLSKNKDESIDILEINKNINEQIVAHFIELFGPKWKYRVIKETSELTGVTIVHGQLKLFTQGKSFHQKNFVALLMVLAHHKKGITVSVSDKSITIN